MLETGLRSAITTQMLVDLERFAEQSFTLPRIAAACNIPEATLRGWISVGESDPTSLEGKAVEALRRGQTHAIAELTSALVSAATEGVGEGAERKDWKAAAFLLERVHGFIHPKDAPEVQDSKDGDTWAQLELALAEPVTPDLTPA